MNSPAIQNLEGGMSPSAPPPPKNLPPTPSSSQQQQIRVFTPVLSKDMQPRYLNPTQQAPQTPAMQTMPGNQHSVSLDLSHHMTNPIATTTTHNVAAANSTWNGFNDTEETKEYSLSAETIQTHAENQARIQQTNKENQARLQHNRQLRQRRVQTVRNIAKNVLPASMGAVDYEGGNSEIVIETKAREIWMTIRDGLRLTLYIVLGFVVIWLGFTILLEYGAEARMFAYVNGANGLLRPELLSKLNPNFHRISTWIRHQAPAYTGSLTPKEANKGLDSVIQITAMMDPSEWGVANWFSRLLGRLFFHKGLQKVKRNMSLRDLDLSMRQAARETKLSCLCAAHVGVPLHAVLCQDTFMLEPILEAASSQTKTARIRDSVLSAAGVTTEFTHNLASYVDYISKTGRKVRDTLGEDKTRCVTYCTNLAQRSI